MEDKSKKPYQALMYECAYFKEKYNTTKCVLNCNSPSYRDNKIKYLNNIAPLNHNSIY